MTAMDYFKRIGAGVKGMSGSSDDSGTSKLATGIGKKLGGIFKKKAKTQSKPFDSGKADQYG